MSSSLNRVMLIGNLGNDPEIRTMQSGSKVANLSIATSESWKDKNTGERREKKEWHKVVVFNEGIVRVCENYLKKGSKVFVEGAIETRKWTDQQGNDKYTTEIVLKPYNGNLTMLDNRGDGQQAAQSSHNQAKADGYQPQGGYDDMDGQIPF